MESAKARARKVWDDERRHNDYVLTQKFAIAKRRRRKWGNNE